MQYPTDEESLRALDTKWMVLDLECSIASGFKRKGNPFLKTADGSAFINGVYYIGYRKYNDTENKVIFTTERPGLGRCLPAGFLDDVDVLVGFNLCGYDLMFYWSDPELLRFFKRGGRVHDCQYAEFLLRAQHQKVHMASLDTVAPWYGGEVKLDAVKACWEQGIDTPDIPSELMLEYLLGVDRQGGDIGNTMKVYLGQVQNLHKSKMYKSWLLRMDGMLCTSMMMYNGIKVDSALAEEQLSELTDELSALTDTLKESLPADLPPEIDWTWSNYQKSAILFGSALKYMKRVPILDDNLQPTYTQAKEARYSYNGKPVPPEMLLKDKPGFFFSPKTNREYECDTFKSGKRIGEYKMQQVPVQGKLKTRLEPFTYSPPKLVEPLPEWATKNTDALGQPVYKTGEDTVNALAGTDIPFIKNFVRYSELNKEIGTYYRSTDKAGVQKGMLTLVQPWDDFIHHSLNHTSVVTTRLSSSAPNMQNIARKDKSKVKRVFMSRFGENGCMVEIDYSQLEIVCQGVLSRDPRLLADLLNKVDFHCKRVALVYGCTYEEAVYRCKDESYEFHALWKGRRTKVKNFSFQRAYGAGAAAISMSTGIPLDEVKLMIEAEDKMYPGIVKFNEGVAGTVERTAKPFFDPEYQAAFRRGYWQAPTGCMYGFRSYPAPSYMKRDGVADTFMPTEMKNYPIQGTGGEFVQGALGKLFRLFIENDNYGGLAFLCNTVHDCIWADAHSSVRDRVIADVQPIMQSIPELYNYTFDMGITVPFPVEVECGPNMYDLAHYSATPN